MSGLFNWGSRNQQVNKLGSVQIQTSEYGVCVPVLFGSNRLAAKLIDYLNFTAKKVTQGGKGGGGVNGYEYYAAVLLLLWKNGQNQSSGIGNIYDAGGAMALTVTSETYTIPGGGGTYAVSHGGTAFYYDEGVTYQAPYSISVNDYGSDGLTTVSGFNTMTLQKVASSPGALQYSVDINGNYTFSGSDTGKTVTISYAYTQTPANTSSISDIGQYAPAHYLNLSLMNGTRPQSAFGYLSGAGHTLGYPGLVLAFDPNMDLGSDAIVPSYNFEGLNGCGLAFGGGVMDCDPAAIISAILTDPFIGLGYGAYLGSLTQLSNYCVANGIFFSPYYDSAKSCSAVLQELITLANAEAFSSWDGKLKVVPYGDTTVVGFGRTFVPVTQPLYDLTIDDFVQDGHEEPLAIDLPDLMDNDNYMKLQFRDRTHSYNVDVIDDINQASVDVIGQRPAKTVTADMITEPEVAQLVLNALMARSSYPYRKFRFKLSPTFPHLEPMDVVTVTHPNPVYGIVKWPVRIKDIEEDDKTAELSCTAEDFPWGAGQPAKYSRATSGGATLAGRDFPGDTAAPFIYEPPIALSKSGYNEVWIGVQGQNANWGGCSVWGSKDGTNYTRLGSTGGARMGTLQNSVASTTDPDTTSVIDIAMAGVPPIDLPGGLSSDADSGLTLSLLGTELIAFSAVAAATFSGVPVEQLSTYIRRGQYGSTATTHSAGERFLRFDQAVFVYEYDPTLIGTVMSLKFTSFNLVGQMEQSLADVPAYTYTPTGIAGVSATSVATTSGLGVVRPDGTSILVSPSGILSTASGGIADIQITVGTLTIAANSTSSVLTATMTGLTTSSSVSITPSSDISSVTGWSPGAAGSVYFTAWPTANTLNYRICNPTGASITLGASTTWNVCAK